MLKFSGYPYLIRGHPKTGGFWRVPSPLCREIHDYAESTTAPPLRLGAAEPASPKTKPGLRGVLTLEQACPSECRGAQCAFKDSMIH